MNKDTYVLLPQPIEEEARELFSQNNIDVVIAENTDKQTVLPLLEKAAAVVLRTGFTMDKGAFETAQSLLTVSRTGAGYDNVDVEAASSKGVIVTSSIGVNTESVVEHCMTLLLALFKQIFLMDREVRAGNFKIRYKNYPRDINNKALGIVGFGKIGSLLAKKCSDCFNMKIYAYDPYVNETIRKRYEPQVEFCSLEELFTRSDAVSVHSPLTEETKDLIGTDLFTLMKKDAFIINASRGGVVNEGDLIKALREGLVRGAGLDVFADEPPAQDNPLLTMDSVIVTPHSAALTEECVLNMATSAVQRVIDVLSGNTPENVINPKVLSLEKWEHLKKS